MTPDICFFVFAHNVTYAKMLAHIRDQVWQFYGNCQTLTSTVPVSSYWVANLAESSVLSLKQISIELWKTCFTWCLLSLCILSYLLSYSKSNSFKIASIFVQADKCSIWTDDWNCESNK